MCSSGPADHGEGLGQHGLLDHAAHLYEEQVRVPLIVRWPGVIPAGVRVETAVGLVDLAPTIAEFASVDFGPNTDGLSLARALRSGAEPAPRTLLGRRRHFPKRFRGELGSKFMVRDDRWKYIHATDGPDELYELTRDSTESRNVLAEHPEIAARLAEQLDAHLSAHPLEEKPTSLTDEERRALELLGYGDH